MHNTAYETGRIFFEVYCNNFPSLRIAEIGSQNVNGGLRDHVRGRVDYVGIDFCAGDGVDVILSDPYKYPFPDASFDILVTSSCLEHSDMFWLSFLEGMRILKPWGIMYCNAPSARMVYHRWPVDCWRFMPDAAKGLKSWARHNGLNTEVLESFTVPPITSSEHRWANSTAHPSACHDWVSVFIKDDRWIGSYPDRMVNKLEHGVECQNIFQYPIDWAEEPAHRNDLF